MTLRYGEGPEAALNRLRRKVKKTQSPAKRRAQTGNIHWIVAKTENKLFTGRAELIHRMQDAFHAGDVAMTQQTRLVITGLGGQGKSEVCIKFASVMREDFWGVFWVDVSNESTAHNGFMAIAKALRSPEKTIEELLLVLASTTKPWLLILDNADDPTLDYTAYFPRGKRGALIMTSRIAEYSKYSTVPSEALEGLDLTLSTRLLLKAAHVPKAAWPSQTKEAENVANLLGSHTLALIQAGAYIAGGHCRLDQYAERYRRHHKQLLQHHPNQRQSRYQNVITTFEASIHAMKTLKSKAGADALELLRIFSIVHHSILPRQLFYDAWVGAWAVSRQPHERLKIRDIKSLGSKHVSRLPSFLGQNLGRWDDRRIDDATDLLVSLSLMARHEIDGDIGWSMHPVVHTWAKDRLEHDQKKHAWIQTCCLCAFSLVNSTIWTVRETGWRPHVRSLVSPGAKELFLYEPPTFMLPLIVHCAWLLSAVREYKALQTLLDGIYRVIDISPWSLAEEYMPIWQLAATSSIVLRQSKLAIHLLEHITRIEATTLSDTDPQLLTSQYSLARAYNDNGQPESAIPLLINIINLYKTFSTHQDWLLESQIELNRCYTNTNRHHEAILLLEDIVRVRESATEPSAPHSLLRSQHALGVAYIAAGRVADAIDLLEHVVTIYESILEESHHDRLAAQNELARAYISDERFDEGVKILQRVEQVQKDTLEETDVCLVSTQYTLGTTYLERGQAEDAVRVLEQVVRMHEVIMNETQPERLSAMYGLARAYKNIGEVEKALGLMSRVVEVRKRTLREDDEVRLESERFLEHLVAGTVCG
ncbi:hypothetical protein BDU57DRAFT_491459 [Ampelomyces quisqualis]|uniref:Uncharacterized protein n=1 Tax=Ampelomyces quisqualis TaxID=50730 RepID=A0A6A5QUX9_AMPQU|nr:hypothetical protein BDU57DRAFT_491459 [Ampelomyces quisqualis]